MIRLLLFLIPLTAISATPLLDDLTFGDAAAESKHHLKAETSEIMRGALEQPARRLLPGGGEHAWDGGRVSFTMVRVAPARGH